MQPVQKQPRIGSLRKVLLCLDWACVAMVILMGIGTAALQKLMYPVARPIFANDATIAYKFMGGNEMHFSVALLVPFVVLVAIALCIECWAAKQGWLRATCNLINLLISLLASVGVVGFLTELFKRLCGRLRPDFLDRCQPMLTADTNEPIPYGTFPNVVCQGTDGKILKDGHMSFPSGHSSCSMAIGLYAAMYLLWCLYCRQKGAFHKALLSPAKSVLGKLSKDFLSFVVLLVVLFELAWPWGVAASRFMDNRHNVSDVIGGMLLAVCFVPIFILRLAANCSFWGSEYQHQQQWPQQQAESKLPAVHGLPPNGTAAGLALASEEV